MNETAARFVKGLEKYLATPFRNEMGEWTIGYGHTDGVDEKAPIITREQADILFREDLEEAEATIKRNLNLHLTANEYTALVSFVFSVGPERFLGSDVFKHLNEGNKIEAARRMKKWVFFKDPNTKNLTASKILEERREKEIDLFLSDVREAKRLTDSVPRRDASL